MVTFSAQVRGGGYVDPFDPLERTPARIGYLFFKYEDPSVDVTTEQKTKEHETIDDTIVIQTMGKNAEQVTVNAVVTDFEAVIIDDLTNQGVLSLRTERWSGDVIVQSTNTSFKRAKDSEGFWLYDATIECLEASEI